MDPALDRFMQAALAEDGMPISAGYVPAMGRPTPGREDPPAAADRADGQAVGPSPGSDQERRRAVVSRFPQLIRDLYKLVGAFEDLFPGRPFTPDGHMVGSLAECYAEFHYGLELYPCSNPGHDAHRQECQVEIKATQGDKIGLRSGPERLLVFRLLRDGSFEEVYNGPGAPVWALVEQKARPSNGQYQIGLAALRQLMKSVPEDQRLRKITG